MPSHFQANRVEKATADKWVAWLQKCSPMPAEGWVSGDNFEITDPEKMRKALLADLTGVGVSVRSKEALVSDFSRFVRSWQIAAWREDISEITSVEELKEIMAKIAEKKEYYTEPQLQSLREVSALRMGALRSTPAAEPANPLTV
jgi:hypothetical protein